LGLWVLLRAFFFVEVLDIAVMTCIGSANF
jgi:hypothetical protein